MSENVLAIAKVWGKGRIQVPQEVRDMLGIQDGDRIYFVVTMMGELIFRKAPSLTKLRYEITK